MQNGLPSDYVLSIFFDRHGIMWVGTDKGLCRFAGGSVEVVNTNSGLLNNAVYDFLQLSDGSVWAGTGSGMAKLELHNGKVVCSEVLHAGKTISKFWLDESGAVYVQSAKHASLPQYTISKLSANMQHMHPLTTMAAMHDAAVNSNGQLVMLRSTATAPGIAIATATPAYSNAVSVQCGNGRTALIYPDSLAVYEDATGRKIYTATMPAGMKNDAQAKMLFSQTVHLVYKSLNPVLFFSSNGKLLHTLKRQDTDGGFNAFCVGIDSSQVVYASDFGKGMIAGANNYVTTYPVGSNVLRFHSNGDVMYANASDKAFNFLNGRGKSIALPPALANIHFLATGTANNLWFVDFNTIIGKNFSYRNGGRNVFADFSGLVTNGDTLLISSYAFGMLRKLANKPLQQLQSQQLNALNAINRLSRFGDTVVLTSLSGGVATMRISDYAVRRFAAPSALLSNTVHDAWLDADTLWVCTDGGVSKIYNNRVMKFGAEQGFVGNRAITVFKDVQGRTWLLSDKLLHLVLNNKLGAIRSFPVLLQSHLYITTAKYHKPTDVLFVGTNNSVEQVSMKAIFPSQQSQPFGVTQVLKGDQVLNLRNGAMRLPSDHGEVLIQLSFPGYSLLRQSERYYKLSGYHTAWQPLPSNTHIKLNRIPPGTYTLMLRSVGPDFGRWQGVGIERLEVLAPFYRRLWFLALIAMLVCAVIILFWRRRLQQNFTERERLLQARATLDAERGRISRELHDNVGSMLTLIINKLEDAPTAQDSKPIVSVARQTLGQLRETIWAIDKPSLLLEEWKQKAMDYLQTLSSAGVPIEFEFVFSHPETRLSPLMGLNFFRIMQEACTNAIRHSKAKKILVLANATDEVFEMHIIDNGIGFKNEPTHHGYGLRNMTKRAAEMKADMQVCSNRGAGTTIIVMVGLLQTNTPNG